MYPLALWRLNDTLGLIGSRLYPKEADGLRREASSGALMEFSRRGVLAASGAGRRATRRRVEGVLVVGPRKGETQP